jgi:hypothetical protein
MLFFIHLSHFGGKSPSQTPESTDTSKITDVSSKMEDYITEYFNYFGSFYF